MKGGQHKTTKSRAGSRNIVFVRSAAKKYTRSGMQEVRTICWPEESAACCCDGGATNRHLHTKKSEGARVIVNSQSACRKHGLHLEKGCTGRGGKWGDLLELLPNSFVSMRNASVLFLLVSTQIYLGNEMCFCSSTVLHISMRTA